MQSGNFSNHAVEFCESLGIFRKFRDHGLFVSYAPAEDPEIAIAVVIEHGSHGSTAAAPVSKAILEAYFAEEEETEIETLTRVPEEGEE